MIIRGRLGAIALGALVLGSGAAAPATSPAGTRDYHAIASRNVFGLKPPAPAPVQEDPAATLPKLFLQGVTTINNLKKALIRMQGNPGHGEAAKGEKSFVLQEGERDGDLEVVQIDEHAGRVTVKNFGIVMDIDFENNGVKAVAAPLLAGQPPAPKPTSVATAPRPNPFAQANAAMNRPLPPLPTFRAAAAR